MWRSVPQIEAASTRIRTSPGPGAGTGIRTSSAPGMALVLRSARIVGGVVRPTRPPGWPGPGELKAPVEMGPTVRRGSPRFTRGSRPFTFDMLPRPRSHSAEPGDDTEDTCGTGSQREGDQPGRAVLGTAHGARAHGRDLDRRRPVRRSIARSQRAGARGEEGVLRRVPPGV